MWAGGSSQPFLHRHSHQLKLLVHQYQSASISFSFFICHCHHSKLCISVLCHYIPFSSPFPGRTSTSAQLKKLSTTAACCWHQCSTEATTRSQVHNVWSQIYSQQDYPLLVLHYSAWYIAQIINHSMTSPWLSIAYVIIHKFPGLEHGLTEFPWLFHDPYYFP